MSLYVHKRNRRECQSYFRLMHQREFFLRNYFLEYHFNGNVLRSTSKTNGMKVVIRVKYGKKYQ